MKNIGKAFASVTPSDQNLLTKDANNNFPSALRFGTGGTAVVVGLDGSEATFVNLQDGEIIPAAVRQVKATGTTATDIIGFYV